MTAILSRRRAELGIVSVLAAAAFFALPALWPVFGTAFLASRLGLAGLGLVCAAALWTSPYWKIVYREAPLKRALTGTTDLDERELALRDRASGLTYYLFATITLCLVFVAAVAMDLGWAGPDSGQLLGAILPYAYFAAALPIIMMEWFEPSGESLPLLEEEEGEE